MVFAEARLQGRVGEINAFCVQLCDWVTRVHDQAGVNLLRDEGERNCVMPFFDQGSVSDNVDTIKWVRQAHIAFFEWPFISHLHAVYSPPACVSRSPGPRTRACEETFPTLTKANLRAGANTHELVVFSLATCVEKA